MGRGFRVVRRHRIIFRHVAGCCRDGNNRRLGYHYVDVVLIDCLILINILVHIGNHRRTSWEGWIIRNHRGPLNVDSLGNLLADDLHGVHEGLEWKAFVKVGNTVRSRGTKASDPFPIGASVDALFRAFLRVVDTGRLHDDRLSRRTHAGESFSLRLSFGLSLSLRLSRGGSGGHRIRYSGRHGHSSNRLGSVIIGNHTLLLGNTSVIRKPIRALVLRVRVSRLVNILNPLGIRLDCAGIIVRDALVPLGASLTDPFIGNAQIRAVHAVQGSVVHAALVPLSTDGILLEPRLYVDVILIDCLVLVGVGIRATTLSSEQFRNVRRPRSSLESGGCQYDGGDEEFHFCKGTRW